MKNNTIYSHFIGDVRIELVKNPHGKLRRFSCFCRVKEGNRLQIANFDTEEKGRIFCDGIAQGVALT